MVFEKMENIISKLPAEKQKVAQNIQDKYLAETQPITWGVSVYPEHSSVEKDKAYLALAAKYGFTRVFTCLLSVGDDVEKIQQEFTELNGFARELGMQVMFDVNMQVFEKFNIQGNDLSIFKEMNADGIRLDMSFGAEGDAALTHNPQGLIIEINTSTSDYLDQLVAAGADRSKIWTCHNFYPQMYTGLALDTFLEKSQKMIDRGMKVGTFISSNEPVTWGPWPISEGLVTVETMRGLPMDYQARYMMATKVTHDILVGNAYASEEELASISKLSSYGTSIKVDEMADLQEIEQDILYCMHIQREMSDFIQRDFVTRAIFRDMPIAPNHTPDTIAVGDVIVINDNLPHYRGELQVAMQELENKDKRYNVVAKLQPGEIDILSFIDATDLFSFIKG